LPFKTFADTNILTASDVNTYLMKQSVIVCTSSTRPAAPNAGMCIYETDTGRMNFYTGAAWSIFAFASWNSWTPTLSVSGPGTAWVYGNTTFEGAYSVIGTTVIARMRITWGSTTTFGTNALGFDLPVSSAYVNGQLIGTGQATDQAPSRTAYLITLYGGGGRFDVQATATSSTYATADGVTSTVPFTWASTDSLDFTLVYQSA
jgi:hypothetical protein